MITCNGKFVNYVTVIFVWSLNVSDEKIDLLCVASSPFGVLYIFI